MLELDGARGEGGGQVVRTAVALAAVGGRAIRVENVRAARSPRGLRPQHRAAIEACAAVVDADTDNVRAGADWFEFRPSEPPRRGDWSWKVGTAGSATLVLQTVLVPLLSSDGPSVVTVEGGTHTRNAPIWEHLEGSYLPILRQMGVEITPGLDRYGFYPAGDGRVRIRIEPPAASLEPLDLPERGTLRRLDATSILADLPGHIARRELETFADELAVYRVDRRVDTVDRAASKGNALYVVAESESTTAVLSEMGQKGRPAEEVATSLAARTGRYLDSGAAVEPHLADQLVVPFALAGGGSYTTSRITSHLRTQLDLVGELLEVGTEIDRSAEPGARIAFEPG